MAVIVFSQSEKEKDKAKMDRNIEDIKKAYAYVEEELLISETDLYCSYFISNKIAEDLVISGAEEMDTQKLDYSDGDRMYINKGSSAGIGERDTFLILAKGDKVSNGLTSKKLGIYYLQKSLAEVTCLYENKAVLTLKNGCYPINIGDILIPFKPVKTVFKRKIDYKRCRLPQSSSAIEGNVVYANVFMEFKRTISGPSEHITIDVGKALVSKGDFILFYKVIKEHLPPIIIGSGIIINPKNNNSTAKVLESAFPIKIGTKFIVLPETEARKSTLIAKGEDIPIIKSKDKDEIEIKPGEESLEVNIIFNINEKSIDNRYAEDFEKIKVYINSKTHYNIILRGYACGIGSLEYNLKLSKERVETIKAYLIRELGIDENFIESYYYGEKDSPFDNSSEEQRRKNRMVKIQVIGK